MLFTSIVATLYLIGFVYLAVQTIQIRKERNGMFKGALPEWILWIMAFGWPIVFVCSIIYIIYWNVVNAFKNKCI